MAAEDAIDTQSQAKLTALPRPRSRAITVYHGTLRYYSQIEEKGQSNNRAGQYYSSYRFYFADTLPERAYHYYFIS
jgi:hypothetical protein